MCTLVPVGKVHSFYVLFRCHKGFPAWESICSRSWPFPENPVPLWCVGWLWHLDCGLHLVICWLWSLAVNVVQKKKTSEAKYWTLSWFIFSCVVHLSTGTQWNTDMFRSIYLFSFYNHVFCYTIDKMEIAEDNIMLSLECITCNSQTKWHPCELESPTRGVEYM